MSGQELYKFTGSDCNTLHRILSSHGIDTRLGFQQFFQSTKQCSASGQYNSPLCNICSQLWWCALQYTVNSFHDLGSGLFQRFLGLLRSNGNRLRKTGYQVTSTNINTVYL